MGSKAPEPPPKEGPPRWPDGRPIVPPPPKRDSFFRGDVPVFVPDGQGGHIVFCGKVWRPTKEKP